MPSHRRGVEYCEALVCHRGRALSLWKGTQTCVNQALLMEKQRRSLKDYQTSKNIKRTRKKSKIFSTEEVDMDIINVPPPLATSSPILHTAIGLIQLDHD